jgi:thymidylate synthase ThyX
MRDRQIYVLSQRELSPETIAVAFAKTSRSPESFREIAAGLTDEKSAQFHEKWVVGYGHASVAEHAVLHVAFENVSRLAIESIESSRLASYTEKSTRFQTWQVDDFHVPSELKGHPLLDDYLKTCRLLFDTYRLSLDPVRNIVLQRTPRLEGESDEALGRRTRSQYVDACRFLLPAAALANVGMTANARVLEHAIRKMLSHELAEVREIGEELKAVAKSEVPTLLKYAEAVPYLSRTSRDLMGQGPAPRRALADERESEGAEQESDYSCKLVDFDRNGEENVLAAIQFRFGGIRYDEALSLVRTLPASARRELSELLLARLDQHDTPLRELEYSTYTFELVMDQGAYAEFKRHRMMTQTPQRLTTRLGYSVPRLIVQAGLETDYRTAMQAAFQSHERLSEFNPYAAQYIVPNGYYRRVLARFNLREAFAFCQLRSAANAHFSIRRSAHKIASEIRRVHPLLAGYMHLTEETAQTITESHFARPKPGN